MVLLLVNESVVDKPVELLRHLFVLRNQQFEVVVARTTDKLYRATATKEPLREDVVRGSVCQFLTLRALPKLLAWFHITSPTCFSAC